VSVDLSKNIFDLFSGKKRIRFVPTLAIAAIVTAAIAIPLTFRANDARNNPVVEETVLAPADAQLVMVDTAANDPLPLDLAVVEGQVLISLRHEQARSVSFNLFAAGAEQAILESQDLAGPQFDLVVSESGGGSLFDTTRLQDGSYELFVTIQLPQEDQRTAVSFQVANS